MFLRKLWAWKAAQGAWLKEPLCVCCADNENIGCLQLTRVGSRRVVQIGACIAIILSIIGQSLLLNNSAKLLPSHLVNDLACICVPSPSIFWRMGEKPSEPVAYISTRHALLDLCTFTVPKSECLAC